MWRMPRNTTTRGKLMGNVDNAPWPSPAESKPTPKGKPAEVTPDAE